MKKLIVLIAIGLLMLNSKAQTNLFEQHLVKSDMLGISTIDYGDFDNDGDIDIAWGTEWTPGTLPTGIHWLENTGDDFSLWETHLIDEGLVGVMSLQVVDLNYDGLPDVLGSAWGSNDVVWYENLGGTTVEWTKHTLISNFTFAHDAYAGCINNDTLLDIVAVAANNGLIKILYNNGSASNPSFNTFTLCNDYDGVRTALSHDFNNDGYIDILAGSTDSDKVYWWQNNGSEEDWTRYLIEDGISGYHNFFLTDFENDGDTDFVAIGGDMLKLYRNMGGSPIVWVSETLKDDLGISSRALASDFDLDADIDIFSVSKIPGKLDLFLNNEGIPVDWTEINIESNFEGAWACQLIDFDNDNDMDIFAGAGVNQELIYLENQTFTTQVHEPKALFTKSTEQSCMGSIVEFKNISVGDIDDYTWNFGTDATPANATGAGPHQVTYSSNGEKVISLTATGTNGSNTYYDTLNVVSELNFNFIPGEMPTECRGDTIKLAIFRAEEYEWLPEPEYLLNNNSVVEIIALDTTTYLITGTLGNCSSDTSITIEVNMQINDDIEDAIMLTIGNNGSFSNVCATSEINEPVPPLTGCNTQESWCNDGGVQNSLWFKFEAPSSGAVEIIADGLITFNNQLAVYDADSWEDLLTGNYSLLAANDDYNLNRAQIENLEDLIVGRIYWVQVDGFAGAEGDNTLIINELNNTKELGKNQNISIYPNPSKGIINIKHSINNQPFLVQVYDVLGNKMLSSTITALQPIDIKNFAKGIYFIKIIDSDNQLETIKLVLE